MKRFSVCSNSIYFENGLPACCAGTIVQVCVILLLQKDQCPVFTTLETEEAGVFLILLLGH